MSNIDYKELRRKFIKSNKQKRERHAELKGYKSAAEYLAFLEAGIAGTLPESKPAKKAKKTKKKASKSSKKSKKPVIHNVCIVDRSGSMDWNGHSRRVDKHSKMSSAIKGVNLEIKELSKDDTVEYRQTIVTFDNSEDYETLTTPINLVSEFTTWARGGTALYQTIGRVLTRLEGIVNPEDKVLVKIFTDGGENCSREYTAVGVAALINRLEKRNFTITFVGTPQDVQNIQRALKIDDSNTLVHDNTAEGMEKAFMCSTRSTVEYSAKVVAGEDVTHGFYKKKGTL